MTNLHNRLADELIGEDLEKKHVRIRKNTHGGCCQCQICGEDYDDCIMNRSMDEDELRAKQRQALTPTIATIEADLKGLPRNIKDDAPDNAFNTGYRAALRDYAFEIERYCRGEG